MNGKFTLFCNGIDTTYDEFIFVERLLTKIPIVAIPTMSEIGSLDALVMDVDGVDVKSRKHKKFVRESILNSVVFSVENDGSVDENKPSYTIRPIATPLIKGISLYDVEKLSGRDSKLVMAGVESMTIRTVIGKKLYEFDFCY